MNLDIVLNVLEDVATKIVPASSDTMQEEMIIYDSQMSLIFTVKVKLTDAANKSVDS